MKLLFHYVLPVHLCVVLMVLDRHTRITVATIHVSPLTKFYPEPAVNPQVKVNMM